MNKTKKSFWVIVLLIVVAVSLPMSVSANAPEPPDYLTITLSNLPENAVYADLLIKIDENAPEFTDFQPNVCVELKSEAEEIVDYSKDGFRSFTFHYKNAKSDVEIKNHDNDFYYVDFCRGGEYNEYLTQYEKLCTEYRDIKIALLDKNFNIIVVSKAAQLPEESDAFVFYGEAYYDFATNCLEADEEFNTYFLVFTIAYSIFIISISVGIEVVLSLLFKFGRKQLLTIFIVNVCSQFIMRALYMVLPFTYLQETIILEILVYTTEFLIYKARFKKCSTTQIVTYTIIANTLSLLSGIYLERIF